MKRCTKCGETKSLEKFGQDKRATDGRRSECLSCGRKRDRAYRETPRARELARQRATKWREANREKARERYRAWLAENREVASEASRRWREKNPERLAQIHKQWRENNRERRSEIQRQRIARQKEALVAEVELDAIIERDGNLCGICWLPVEEVPHLDHIFPLAAGGTHEPDNVQIAHPACNRRKGAKVNFTLAT